MSFWQKKSVLVTGASGFVGMHLVNSLISRKAEVVTFSKNEAPVIKNTAKVEIGTVEDFKKLNSVIRKNKIEIIYHLAAQPIVEIGHTNPIKTFEVNIGGTWNILESARQNRVQKVIIASTVHVYGDNPRLPYKEEYFPQPSRPYETSKACADLLAQSFADTYDLTIEIPRFVNIYGPGDTNFSRLIPKVIKGILKGKNLKIWDVGSIRDFLYIDDVIRAYLMLAEKNLPKQKRGRIINFGTGKPVGIVDLVEKIMSISNKRSVKIEIEKTPADRSNEIIKQYVSTAKAKSQLGWYPKTPLELGLAKTYEWYKKNVDLL